MGLVGTMAHELAHVRLLGESRIMREEFDNELLTDLTTVAFGLGVFLANTPRNWDSHLEKWPDSDLNRPEYMSPPMFGYALAHLALARRRGLAGLGRVLELERPRRVQTGPAVPAENGRLVVPAEGVAAQGRRVTVAVHSLGRHHR